MDKFRDVIGVDVSKAHLDWAWINSHFEGKAHGKVANEEPPVLEWIGQLAAEGPELSATLFCVEQTGYYSRLVIRLLQQAGLSVWAASPLQIHLARGLQRGKTDPVDADRIARFASRNQDKARLADQQSEEGERLRQLLSQRRRLVTDRAAYKTQRKELPSFLDEEAGRLMHRNMEALIGTLDEAIGQLEQAIRDLIRQMDHFAHQYKLLTTIDGVGPVLAWTVIAATDGFSTFKGPRSFACHAGVAPFPDRSGTYVKPPHVSPLANKRLKSLLHMAAMTAIQRPGELQSYYQRKIEEGKPKMSVINAVRNKLIHRMYAVIKHDRPYQSEPLAA